MVAVPEWATRVRGPAADCAVLPVAPNANSLSDADTAPFIAAGRKCRDGVAARALFLTSADVGVNELYACAARHGHARAATVPPAMRVDAPTQAGACAC
jgi:hypothetical protein